MTNLLKNEAERVYRFIEANDNFLIVSHKNPDGDTLGSAAALMEWLFRQGKKFKAYCADPVPDYLQFLPFSERISTNPEVLQAGGEYSAVIVLDSSDLTYAGLVGQQLKGSCLINIDHHSDNRRFGHYNIVWEEAAATTVILYYFFRLQRVSLTTSLATSLLCGLVTDTSLFSNPATNSTVLSIAGELVKQGGNLREVTAYTWRNKDFATLKTWGKVLERLHLKLKNQQSIVAAVIPQTKQICGQAMTPDGLANFLSGMVEAAIVVVVQAQTDDILKVSLRTTRDNIDVGKLAKILGGGGHRKAAGFSLSGQLEQTNNGWRVV